MYLAVLTGDIVASTEMKASELDSIMNAIQSATLDMADWTVSETTVHFSRRGGDAWQVATPAPKYAIRSALFLQANVRRLDKSFSTRIAAAIGEGTLPDTAPIDINSAHGPVFTASGRLLDSISGHHLMEHSDGGALGAVLELCSHIAQGWTPAQARALCEMLSPHAGSRAQAGIRLGISRQAVDQALWAAGFPAIEAALHHLEAN
ncbi:MAG: MarR family transcriptional regulator [Paracoccaceae bacterium]